MLNQRLTTELRNPASETIDQMDALQVVELMNAEDAKIADAVHEERHQIAAAIDVIADRMRNGGRLVYIGAGTSGRLGVLDASECPPTFSTPPEMVVGLIAGGDEALTRSIEGAEDHREFAVADLQSISFNKADVLVGIGTSGRTPYVIGGINYARKLGAFTVGFSCNVDSPIADSAELAITPVVGPEVVSGSTRLKAGTATKMVLNMLTTGTMVLLGKTYGNLMVDLTATNEKLVIRSTRIAMEFTDLDETTASQLLKDCDGELKTAIVSFLGGLSAEDARAGLANHGGHLRKTLDAIEKHKTTLDREKDSK